ncbi:MAG TPA: RluA family pseudouridine synthase [Thermomicrobiales bacterium]|nr:RluA family pseudouridine synthase [Thermomicrobiales bacterium]
MTDRTSDRPEDDAGLDIITLHPTPDDRDMRLDRFISEQLPDLSRTYLQSLIESGNILVDGQARRRSFKVTHGEVITVTIPETEEIDVLPERIPLDIVYEDSDVIVVNKRAGMVVHPAPGHATGTLVNAILGHAKDISIVGSTRPGIVHRLDKDTSGLIVVAKTDRAQNLLMEQWQERSVEKRYITLAVRPFEEDEATVDAPIGRNPANRQQMAVVRSGRHAVSHFRVARRFLNATLLDAQIETGRTHQIRVHLQFIRHAVVGDDVYGVELAMRVAEEIGLRRQFLHAAELGLTLPNGERKLFKAPLPDDLSKALIRLEESQAPLDDPA